MTRFLLAGAAALAIAVSSTGSYAVDLTNEDQQNYQVTTIMDGGMATLIDVPAGQTVKGICEECSLILGEQSLEVSGAQQASIKDGKVKVQ